MCKLTFIFYILIGLLFTFLGISYFLKKNNKISEKAYKELLNRTVSWIFMVVILSVFFFFGSTGTTIIFMLISFFVFREFISLAPVNWKDYWVLIVSFYIVIPAQYYLVWDNYYGFFSILIPVYVFGIIPALTALLGQTKDFLQRVALIQWGQFIAIYNISYIPALFMLDNMHIGHKETIHSLNLIVYLLIIVQFSDIAQFICGKLFGKHRIAPEISPNKTVEGLIGGGLCAILLGVILRGLTPFSLSSSIVISALLVLAGFLGGLSLSGVKRSLHAKDWGYSIPGHGGFMDRMDSLTFSAPIFFHVVRYFYS